MTRTNPQPGEANASSPATPNETPLLRVVNPDATDEEIAAIVAVFASLGAPAPTATVRPEWGAPHRKMTPVFPHGRGGWRASSLPR